MTKIIAVAIAAALSFASCNSFNKAEIKENACATWKQAGYECVGYEGFQWSYGVPFTAYGGAKVWHTLKRPGANNIIYTGFIKRWGDEYHIYGPYPVDQFSVIPSN